MNIVKAPMAKPIQYSRLNSLSFSMFLSPLSLDFLRCEPACILTVQVIITRKEKLCALFATMPSNEEFIASKT